MSEADIRGRRCGTCTACGPRAVSAGREAVGTPVRVGKSSAEYRGLWRSGHLVRLAVVAWIIITVLSVGRAALIHHRRHCGCYPVYAQAGRAWIAGQDLYTPEPGLDVYRYSPLVAVMLAPCGALPDMLGSAVLRAVNVLAFLASLYYWSRSAAPLQLNFRQRAALFLLAAPLAARSLIDVQVNGLLISLLLFAVTAVAEDRWNWAAVCLVLACLLKAYVVSLALVLILLYPRQLLLRFGLLTLLGLALPLAFQDPRYVLRQYQLWVLWGLNNRECSEFQDLPFLLANLGIHLTRLAYTAIQLGSALAVALVCLWQQRTCSERRQVLNLVLGLACCWMMLLGPATEGCTYILLAPTMAWVALEAGMTERPTWMRTLALSGFVLFTFGQFAFWFPWGGSFNGLGTFPLCGLLTAASVLAADLS